MSIYQLARFKTNIMYLYYIKVITFCLLSDSDSDGTKAWLVEIWSPD